MSVAGLLLAAGASRRMGQAKQLLELEGESLVHRAARVALEAGLAPVIVVVGCHEAEVGAACAGLPVQQVMNEGWAEGMASSIRVGVKHLVSRAPRAEAVLLLACDQPAVDADFLLSLLRTYLAEPERIIAAAYGGGLGIPALFPYRCFEALIALTGDRGARALLESGEPLAIPLPRGEQDLDTPEDLRQFTRR